MTNECSLNKLIDKYLEENTTGEEAALVDAWYTSFGEATDITDILSSAELKAVKQRMKGKLECLFDRLK